MHVLSFLGLGLTQLRWQTAHLLQSLSLKVTDNSPTLHFIEPGAAESPDDRGFDPRKVALPANGPEALPAQPNP